MLEIESLPKVFCFENPGGKEGSTQNASKEYPAEVCA